ncbi:MAG: hypothetical protein PHU85_00140 [Phycisphaerae bacterium]|nr:hypothetical protein [Phycisphaerae bacterium]
MAGYMIGDTLYRRIQKMLRWFESGAGRGTPAGTARAAAIPQQPWQRFYNESGQTIPAHGAVILSNLRRDQKGFPVADAARPAKFEDGPVYINGESEVAAGAAGFALYAADEAIEVAYDGPAPEAGDCLGIAKDSFKLKRYHPGFRALSDGAEGLVWAVREGFPGLVLAKVTQAVSGPDEPGEVTLYADETLSMTFQVEAWDPLLTEGEDIDVGTWCYVSLNGKGCWCIHEPQCEEQT